VLGAAPAPYIKIYDYQMKRPLWILTTPFFKETMMENYQELQKRKTAL